MVSLHSKSHDQASVETRPPSSDAAPIESDNPRSEEYDDPISRSPGYARWEFAQNYFSGFQSVLSEMIDTWRRRRSKRS